MENSLIENQTGSEISVNLLKNQEEKVEELYKWMIEDQNRVCSDKIIPRRFLQWAKWDIDKAKFRLNSFYKYRIKNLEWFQHRDITKNPLKDLIDIGVFLPLKELNQDKQLILFSRPTKYSPNLYHLSELFKTSQVVADVLIYDNIYGEAFCHDGIICVIDLQEFSYSHAKQYSPILVAKMVFGFQNSYPARLKCIAFINAPRLINMLLKIFIASMSSKLRNRIKVCYSTSILEEFCDRTILPEEYGGSNGTVQDLIDYWKGILFDKREWILQIEENL